MVYKCSSCGFDAEDKRGIAAHMLTFHNSEFKQGDEELVALSAELKKDPAVEQIRRFHRGGA